MHGPVLFDVQGSLPDEVDVGLHLHYAGVSDKLVSMLPCEAAMAENRHELEVKKWFQYGCPASLSQHSVPLVPFAGLVVTDRFEVLETWLRSRNEKMIRTIEALYLVIFLGRPVNDAADGERRKRQ